MKANVYLESVYLVWTGEYEYAQVVAVFAHKHHADALVEQIEMLKNHHRPIVEERPLSKVKVELYSFCCHMSEKDIIRESGGHVELASNPSMSPWYTGDGNKYGFFAFGTSPEHARKNCADFRRAWLASHQGSL